VSQEIVMALFNACIDLATTPDDLTRWGREHATLIGSQLTTVIQSTRARYAERLADLKEAR
jgi:hypothetical protein